MGKTYTAVQLLRLLRGQGMRCAGYKPICCGDRADAEQLLAASSTGLTIEEVNPVWLKTPAAPWPAAQKEDRSVNIDGLLAGLDSLESRFDFVVVEGVGGWLVPITADYFVSDLAVAMGLPVLVVAMNRLGCLNHTMLTVRSVAACGLFCLGVALNDFQAGEDFASRTNGDVLRQITGAPVLPGLSAGDSELSVAWRRLMGV